MAAPAPSRLDYEQCIQGAYDETEGRLRVETELATVDIGGNQEILITDAVDSIKIGNGSGQYLAINPDGSINVDGSFTPVGTQDVQIEGLNQFQTSQYIINTSPVQITPTPLSNRSSISIRSICTGSNYIYIGNSSSVSTSTGYPMSNGDTLQMDLTTSQTIYAVATASGQTICALEIG